MNWYHLGFNDNEIECLFNKVFKEGIDKELRIIKKLKDKLRYWYNGQMIGNMKMYTPSSVMGYFSILSDWKESGPVPKFRNYWARITKNLMKPILDAIKTNSINLENYFRKLKEITIGKYVEVKYNSEASLISLIEDFEFSACRIENLFSHILIKTGYITEKNKSYGYLANEVKIMIENYVIEKRLNERVFLNTWNDFSKLARTMNFHKDNIETIAINIGKLVNRAKHGFEKMNEELLKQYSLQLLLSLSMPKNMK